MLHGVRSGAGKLIYSNNDQFESFDGEWEDNLKKNGLLTYREYFPWISLVSICLVTHDITERSPTTSAMGKEYSTFQVAHGMKERGVMTRCTETMASAVLKTYSPTAVNFLFRREMYMKGPS